MKRIPLTQGQFALVDDADFAWLSQWKWYAAQDKVQGSYMACRRCTCPVDTPPKKQRQILMHRQVMSCPADYQVDHADHNKLNNQRSNLRICTPTENKQNSLPYRNSSSKYKGIHWFEPLKKWQVHIRVNKKKIHLGYYCDEIYAAGVYDKAAKQYFGEFAYLNFPESEVSH